MGKLMTLNNVSAAYDGNIVLEDVNLTVEERDFLGVIGPNGGGKTTLIKIILGLLKPVSGSVRFYKDGQEAESLRMGYLPQYTSIDRKFPVSVYETVISGLGNQTGAFFRYSRTQHQEAMRTIRQVGLEGMEDLPLGQLSGGQLQRALLGRALVSRPDVLILDEPSTYLDQRYESLLYDLLNEVNRDCAVILVSHDIGTVLQNVRSIACVSGRLYYHPTTSAVTTEWIERHFGCPIDLLGHGHLPHRVLACHHEK